MNYQSTKNQHYVPKCLLKNFCYLNKNKKKINIFDVVNRTVRYNQAIKNVFSQNYFYGKDTSIDDSVEAILANKIEDPASTIIDEIIQGNLSILDSPENKIHLLKFVSTLIHRTPEAKEGMLSFIQTGFQSFSKELLRLNNFPSEARPPIVSFKDTDVFAAFSTLQGYYGTILLTDLEFHLIENQTELDFVISDNPAFTYNYFYKNLEHPGVASPIANGYQIFLPLSSRHTLCLYDSKVYTYKPKTKIIISSNLNDIRLLNKFQIMNSKSIIGFNDPKSEHHITEMYQKFGLTNIYTYKSNEYEVERKNDEIRTRHITYIEQNKLNQMPSFINIRKKAKKYSQEYSIRNYELLNLFEQSMKKENHDSIIPL